MHWFKYMKCSRENLPSGLTGDKAANNEVRNL